MDNKKKLNNEDLKKVNGGNDQNDKWYFCYYHISSQTYVGNWTGPYDSADDYELFASEHPIENPGEYQIKAQLFKNTGRTINTYI